MCGAVGYASLCVQRCVFANAARPKSLQPDRKQQILLDSHHFLSQNLLLLDESLRQSIYENSEFSSLTSSGARFPNFLLQLLPNHRLNF